MTTTLFVNGTIRTNIHGEKPHWLLIEDGRVAGVHPSSDFASDDRHSVANWQRDDVPPADRVIDLQGGTLAPAFCDAHVHLPATGLYESGMDLRGERSRRAILERFAARASDEGLLFGGNFEDPDDGPILASHLDDASGNRAALLTRADMHSCVVSSPLLRTLGLGQSEGVDLDEDGRPTGYLREKAAAEAFRWFEAQLPRSQQIDAIRAAVRKAYSKGVSSVHEMFVVEWRGWDSYDLFLEAVEPVALDVVVYLGTDEVDEVVRRGHDRIGGDFFLDGSFGSHTAWMNAPFATPPPPGSPPTGISYRSDDDLFDFFRHAQERSLQVGVHAIGDAAIDQAIRTWQRVANEVGDDRVRSLGHRIEHFECASDEHIVAAATLGLRASVQPAFDLFWGGEGGLYSERIGPDRARRMNRFKTMIEAGVPVGAGSDSTVTPLDPFLQMEALRSHHVPEQRLDGEAAFGLHTIGSNLMSARAARQGDLSADSVADLMWLDRDPVTTAAGDLCDIEVLGTWVAGVRVWPDSEAESS